MRCDCGKEIDTTGSSFSYRITDNKGKVIFEICSHGVVVIDELVHLKGAKERSSNEKHE